MTYVLRWVALVLILALGACSTASHLANVLRDIDWRDSPVRRQADEIQELGQRVLEESARLVYGQVSNEKTVATLWRTRYDTDSVKPTAIPKFASRLLQEAYRKVPRALVERATWQDTTPTFASTELGVVVNRTRAADLAWKGDSASLIAGEGLDKRLLVRPPGDYALLIMLSHELAHLAIDFSRVRISSPQSLVECAADITAGFQSSAIASRISSAGRYEFETGAAIEVVANSISPGDWISGDLHPDREQRLACIRRGVAMFSEQQDREPIAGGVLLSSRRDSLIDALSLGHIELVAAAFQEAESILSIPGTRQFAEEGPFSRAMRHNPATPLLGLADSLLSHLNPDGMLIGVAGPDLPPGVSLFPDTQLRLLALHFDQPWKCAVVRQEGKATVTIACYVVAGDVDVTLIRSGFGEGIASLAVKRGFLAKPIHAVATRNPYLHLDQWLIELGLRRALVSIYDEPFSDRILPDKWGGRRLLWFSFDALGTNSDRTKRSH